jgi:hypothetical protein
MADVQVVRAHVAGPGERSALAAELTQAAQAFGVNLTLVHSDRGVYLEGMARTFYGKQMAQELARKANLVVAGNRIRVCRAESREHFERGC